MGAEVGSFTAGSTGNKTLLLNTGSTPQLVKFWVGNRSSTNETDIRFSTGTADFVNSNQYAIATFAGTNKGTRSSNSKCIMHYIDSGGATLKVQGSMVSASGGQFVVNMDTVDASYTIYFEAYW